MPPFVYILPVFVVDNGALLKEKSKKTPPQGPSTVLQVANK